MLISQSSDTANYNAWDEDIAMVKVNFNVQKILVAHSQQLSLCALYNQSSSDILWKRLNVRVQKVSLI